MTKLTLLGLTTLLFASQVLAQTAPAPAPAPSTSSDESLLDQEQDAKAGSGFNHNIGAVHPDGTRSLNRLLSPISPCKPGTTCDSEVDSTLYLKTILSRSMPREYSEVFAMAKTYGLMYGPLGDVGLKHMQKTMEAPTTKFVAIVKYSDPVVAESLYEARDQAYQDASHTLERLNYFATLSEQVPQFRMMWLGLQGCIVTKMRDEKLDQNTAIKACSADKIEVPGQSGLASASQKKSDPNALKDERFSLDDMPLAQRNTTGSKSAQLVDTKMAGGVGALTKAGVFEKQAATSTENKKQTLSELIYKSIIDRVTAANSTATATANNALTGTNPVARLEASKKDFVRLAGDLVYTSFPNKAGTVDESIVPAGLNTEFLTPIVYSDKVDKRETKEQVFQNELNEAWNLLTEEAGRACTFYVIGGENATGQRDQRGKKSYYHHRMELIRKKKLSIEGMPLTPSVWDIMMWFTIQGRTIDKVQDAGTCDSVRQMTGKLEDFKKKESLQTKDVRDMQRAFFWYASFIAAGKTIGVYESLERDLTEIGMQSPSDDRIQLVTQAIALVRRASGFDNLGDGGIQGAQERNVEDFSDFIEKLKRYRQGIPSAVMAAPSDANNRPTEVLGAGGK